MDTLEMVPLFASIIFSFFSFIYTIKKENNKLNNKISLGKYIRYRIKLSNNKYIKIVKIVIITYSFSKYK